MLEYTGRKFRVLNLGYIFHPQQPSIGEILLEVTLESCHFSVGTLETISEYMAGGKSLICLDSKGKGFGFAQESVELVSEPVEASEILGRKEEEQYMEEVAFEQREREVC